MTLPTLTKTWIYNVGAAISVKPSGGNSNYAPFDYLNWLVLIKDAMCATSGWVDKDGNPAVQNNPWTVAASSTGEIVGLSDNWSSYLSLINNPATPSYRFNGSTKLAWIVLQNGALGAFQFLIGPARTAESSDWTTAMSAYCSWDGFDLSAPAVTVLPTSSDKLTLFTSKWITGAGNSTSTFDGVFHVAMSTDGECTRILGCREANVVLFWQIEKVKDPPAQWAQPIVVQTRNTQNYTTRTASAALLSAAYYGAKPGASNPNKFIYTSAEGYSTGALAAQQYTPGHLRNEYPLFSVGLVMGDSAPYGRVGSLYDFWFTTLGAQPGLCFPGSGPRQLVSLGGAVIPWTDSTLYMTP